MLCVQCGATLADDARFCGSCGWAATREAVSSIAYRDAPTSRDPTGPPFLDATASFGSRLGAYILDSIFATILALLAGGILAIILVLLVGASQDPPVTRFEQAEQDDALETALIAGFYLGYIPMYYAYHWISASLGRGWGKRILGLRIIDVRTGGKPGWGSGLVRVLMSIVSGILLIGYLWSLWDSEKRTWHDRAAATTVIYTR
jgi:uncharacterized RDD family membrane protein YckC